MPVLMREQICHIWVHATKTLWLPTWKTNYNAEKCASDVKKMKNHRKQNSKGGANNMQLDKEDTRRSNLECVFNILILLFVFIMSNKLTCEVRFYIARHEAWVNAVRASSFIKNVPQISPKIIAFQRNFPRKVSWNQPFFCNHFPAKLASKILAKLPRNGPFFPRICPWKFREIWLFFFVTYQKPWYYDIICI